MLTTMIDADDDACVRAFCNAAADLLQGAMRQAEQDDPEGAAGVMAALARGAVMNLSTMIAPATGTVHLSVHVITEEGQQLLMARELQPQHSQ